MHVGCTKLTQSQGGTDCKKCSIPPVRYSGKMIHELEVWVIVITATILPAVFQACICLLAIPQNGVEHCAGGSGESTEEVHRVGSRPLWHRVVIQGCLIERVVRVHNSGNVIFSPGSVPCSSRHWCVVLGVQEIVEVHQRIDEPAQSHGSKVSVGVSPKWCVQRLPERDIIPVETDVSQTLIQLDT